ncbi:hypothetical protein D3C83_80700 [compost metagenome]
MICGGTPAEPLAVLRAIGFTPAFSPASREPTNIATAPSFTPDALPAVVTPPSYSDFIFESASTLVSGRGCSSSATGGVGPLRDAGISTGEISPLKKPSPFAIE